MELTYLQTIVISAVLINSLLCLTIFNIRLNLFIFIIGFLYLLVSFPLGHDTLNYKFIIEDGYLPRYGLIWSILDAFSNFFNNWKFVHFISYVIIICSFFKLSKTLKNSNLALTILLLSPAIGFDFLSIIRQALATAAIIFAYLLGRKKSKWEYLLYLVAGLLHVSAFIYALFVFTKKINITRSMTPFRFLFVILTLFIFVSLTFVFLIQFELLDTTHFIEFYITNDDSVQSGKFVLIYWVIALGLPLILNVIFGISNNSNSIKQYLLFFSIYICVWMISSPTARIMWYFIPILFIQTLNEVELVNNKLYTRLYRVGLIILTFLSANFGLLISHDNYWVGYYE